MALNNNLIGRFVNKFNHLDVTTRLSVLAVIVGILGGFSAVIFRLIIRAVFILLYYLPYLYLHIPFVFLLLIIPPIGGLIVSLLATRVTTDAAGHGIPEIIETVAYKNGNFKYSVPFAKLAASSITLGTGGAAGREGPIAQIGAAFGSILGQIFHLTTEEKRDLVVSGVAAGLSATFNAPLGSILFAIEIIRRDNKSPPLIPLIISSVIGAYIGIVFIGPDPFFAFPKSGSFVPTSSILLIIIGLGFIAGFFSIIWIRMFHLIEFLFSKIKLSTVAKTTFGAFLVGVMQLLLWINNFPIVFWVDIGDMNLHIGQGTYNLDAITTINDAFKNTLGTPEIRLLMLFLLIFIGMVITSVTLGSGNSGGSLAPTLWIGVMIGAFVGVFLQQVLHLSEPNIAVMAILGMAAFFAGSIRSPFTAIIMTAEMISDYTYIVPLMFAVAVAYIVSRIILRSDLYTYGLAKKGYKFTEDFDAFDETFVEEIMIAEKDIMKVYEKDRLENVLKLLGDCGHTGFPVVNEDNRLVGIVTEHDLGTFYKSGKNLTEANVGDICTKNVVSVLVHCPISTLISVMAGRKINRIPIVDSSYHLRGWVTRSDVFRYYINKKHLAEQDKFERELFENPFILEMMQK